MKRDDKLPTSPSFNCVHGTGKQIRSGHPLAVLSAELTSQFRDWDWVAVVARDAAGAQISCAPAVVMHESEDSVQRATSDGHSLTNACLGLTQSIREPLRIDISGGQRQIDFKVSLEQIAESRFGRWDQEPEKQPWSPRFLRRFKSWMPTVHVMTKTIKGELTLAEQNAVMLEALTLDALGIASGDEVVLTAVTNQDGKYVLIHKAVKAYCETDLARERRWGKAAGETSHELPNLWIGEALRMQLGINLGDASSGVIVSPRRWYAVQKDLREFAIIMAVAALGLKDLAPEGLGQVAIIASGSLAALLLVLWRVRTVLR